MWKCNKSLDRNDGVAFVKFILYSFGTRMSGLKYFIGVL